MSKFLCYLALCNVLQPSVIKGMKEILSSLVCLWNHPHSHFIIPCFERTPWYHQSSPSLTASHLLLASGPACLLMTQWSNMQGEERPSVLRQQPLQHCKQKGLYFAVLIKQMSILFVCIGACVCVYTTLGSRLFCRSGISVWVRTYTPAEFEINVFKAYFLWSSMPLLNHEIHVSPIVFVAKFFSSPSAVSSLLCTMQPALFIWTEKKPKQSTLA